MLWLYNESLFQYNQIGELYNGSPDVQDDFSLLDSVVSRIIFGDDSVFAFTENVDASYGPLPVETVSFFDIILLFLISTSTDTFEFQEFVEISVITNCIVSDTFICDEFVTTTLIVNASDMLSFVDVMIPKVNKNAYLWVPDGRLNKRDTPFLPSGVL